MKNTLTDLNNYLFEALERVNDDSLSQEQLETEMKKADATKNIALVIVQNAKVQLDAIKHQDEYGYNTDGTRQKAILGLLGADK